MAIIIGTSGNDKLNGTTAADDIQGQAGDDVLDGGSGNDLLDGGIGHDIYVYRPGSGSDVISELNGGGIDTLQFQSVLPSQVLLFQQANNLIVRFSGVKPDQITISGFFDPPPSTPVIERMAFGPGTVWEMEAILNRLASNNSNVATEGGDTLTGTAGADTIDGLGGNDTISGSNGNDQLFGGSGNDSLFGEIGDDLLVGGAGNDLLRGSAGSDTLQGGTGNDVYAFMLGHDGDVISEEGGFDTILFTTSNTPEQASVDPLSVRLTRSGDNLIVSESGSITVVNHFSPVDSTGAIEQIAFADGTVWNAAAIQNRVTSNNRNTASITDDVIVGTANPDSISGMDGNDTISGGNGNDQIVGDLGNDRLFGNDGDDFLVGGDGGDSLWGNAGNDLLDAGAGSDTYHFNSGDGRDVIIDGDTGGDFNRLAFGAGIRIQDLDLQQDGGDLVINLRGSADSIRLTNTAMPGESGRRAISSLEFADGLVISLSASPANTFVGTDYNDQLFGTQGADTLYALGGDDVLFGNDGNDTLFGGTGNDQLNGGLGSDRYVFNAGDGVDRIEEMPAPGESNQVVFGAGIGYSDLNAYYDHYVGGVVVDVGTAGDQLILANSSSDPYGLHTVDSFVLGDGTVATYDAVLRFGQYTQGTEFNDWISGSYYADSLYGNGGDDSLYGDSGNDILAGGQGFDYLSGGAGDDTYVYNRGDSMDYVDDYAFAPIEGNRVLFGEGITVDDLRLRIDVAVPVLEIAGIPGDGLRFSNFNPLDPNAPRSVETFDFADGTTLSYEQLIERGFYVGGTEGGDWLEGSPLNDRLYGYGGDDWLVGRDGNDTLIGGSGHDQLDGGLGDDTYVFASGDGFDNIAEGTIWGPNGPEAGGTDTVRLLDGYDPGTTLLYRYGNDLAIRNGQTGDETIVREHFGSYLDGSTRAAIERISFADGTVWNAQAIASRVASFNNNMPTEGSDTIAGTPTSDYLNAMGGNDTVSGGQGDDQLIGGYGNDQLFGGAGMDSLQGESGNDTLAGGTGEDFLAGGAGNDTYLFNLGDGQDRIDDVPMMPGESNRVVFGEGIRLADLRAYTDYSIGGVAIDFGTTGDRLLLVGASPDPYYGPQVISSFQFADGTVATMDAVLGWGSYQQGKEFSDWLTGSGFADSLYGNGGDDTLYGDSGNDILVGGQGNDVLSGGAGDDTYVFNRGDGMDYIDDHAFAPFEGNRVLFGEGITVDDLRLRIDVAVPLLEIAGMPGDGLQFSNFNPLDPNAPRSVETFEFADGTTLSVEQLIARGFYVGGTEWGDYLIGSPYNDRIYGYGGDDWLQGLEGNDVLIGGTGFDQLDGGLGNDTYVFAAGDGFDMIWEGSGTPEAGGSDTVQLLDGYDPATTELYRYGNDLAIRNGTTGEQVIVREQFGGDFDGSRRAAIEQIMFADGTTWDAAAISARIATMNSNWTTAGSDTVGGTPLDDFLFGYGGNDALSGGAGNDILDGAAGNDRLFGGAGDDRLWDMGGGNDLLAGGTGNDFLSGGAGHDTYRFNLGDGVDQIEEMPAPGETNRVVFGDGIGFHDLRAGYDTGTGQAVIDIGSNGDQLRIANGYPDPYAPHAIDTFTFADGTVASFDALFGYAIYFAGSQFDDSFSGTGRSDGLYGNSGNDWLYGYDGNDFIGGGQGNDWLNGGAGNDTYQFNRGDGLDTIEDSAAPGERNRVLFGAGITLDDLRLRFGGPESLLEVGSNGDALRLLGFSAFDPSVPYPIELFEFADGSTITAEELIARGFHVEGSDYWGEYLPGSEYNDRIFGLGFDDRLFGYAGDDTLVGGIHNDQLDGGTGNDTYVFYSGDGYDTIWEGSGTPDAGGVDTVKLGFGFDPTDAELYRYGNDLKIRNRRTGEQIDVREHFGSDIDGSTRTAIERIAFADGTIWGAEAIASRVASMNGNQVTEGGDTIAGGEWNDYLSGMGGNDTISGGFGDDTLSGDSGNDWLFGGYDNDNIHGGEGGDVLAGGAGNDLLNGGAGNDTYLFNLGDGTDVIYDWVMDGEQNQVVFGEGIHFRDLQASYDYDSGELRIEVGSYGDQLRLAGASLDPYSPHPVDVFRFTDGTVATFDALIGYGVYLQGGSDMDGLFGTQYADGLYGGRGDDVLFADSGDDFLGGGQGNDWLGGYAGDDTYLFNLGDGVDFIEDYTNPEEGNRVLFGNGIGLDDVRLVFDGWSAHLEIGVNGDAINFSSFNPLDPQALHSVDTFEFADGSTLSYQELIARGFYVGGADGGEWLEGSALNDRIYGYGGDDWLVGRDGNDTLVGGTGNDRLDGGFGNDTYVFAAGDGFDLIEEGTRYRGPNGPEAGGMDTVKLLDGYDPATTELYRYGNDLAIRSPMGEEIIVREHFGSYVDGSTRSMIEQISFADGTVWNVAAINSRIASFNSNSPTDGGDTIGGTLLADYIDAMGGSDTVSGGAGDDVLDGGTGNDHLFGGAGNDLIAGNDGNDLLAGGTGNDMLDGGAGNDVYLFNLGDGQDRIDGYPIGEESDRVQFGEGIRFPDLRAYTDFNAGALAIDVGNGGDRLLLTGAVSDPYGPRIIDRFQFADGTVATYEAVIGYGAYQLGGSWNESLYGTQYGDSLYGNGGDDQITGGDGNDILSGGQGNDWLSGGWGNDSYLFNAGDGVDFIDDHAFGPLDGNRVVFGSGIAAADLWLTLDGPNAKLGVGTAGDGLVLGNFNPMYPQGAYPVETFEFADGSAVSFAQLLAEGFLITGSSADDFLNGTMVNDRIYAGAGNDTVYGYDGDNTLYGEAGFDALWGGIGNDTLSGGANNDVLAGFLGSDRYLFNPGDGMDFIDDSIYFSPADDNRVVFGSGIGLADLRLRSSGTNGWLEIGTLGDVLNFSSFLPWDPAADRSVQTFEFADGAILTTDELLTAINEAPVVGGPLPDQVATEDSSWGLTIPFGMFLDPNGGPMTYSASLADGSPLPSWLGFDATTQTLYGVPQNGNVGTLALRVTATDSLGAATSSDFNLTVLNVNDAPTVSTPLVSQAATEDNPFSYTVPADAFTDVDAGDSLTYMAFQTDGSPLPSWLGFDPMTLTFSGTPGNADVGTLNVRVKAFDTGLATAFSDFVLTVANVNDAPAVSVSLADQATTEDTAFSFTVPADAFADVDVGDALTLSATLADDSVLPAWLSFDAATRTFSGTPENGDVGNLAVRVMATDSTGATASSDFVLVVANTNDAPVAGAALANQSVNEDSAFTYALPVGVFSDVDAIHGDTLAYTASLADGSPLPVWLSFDAATRTVSGTPGNGDVGTVNVRVTATDAAGAVAAQTFTLTVANANDAPVAASTIPDQSAAEGPAFSFQIAADAFADVDAGDTLSFGATLADGSLLPDWLRFDAATRSFTGTPGDGSAGDYAIKVTATDSNGANVSDEFVVSIADTIATVRTGTSGVDTLQGTAFRDVLNGLGSNDILYGYAGDDLLDGGTGSDTMVGGTGNDTYVVGGTGDVVVENANEGFDTVQSSVTYTLGTNVENLTLTGTSNRSGTGNSLDNVLTGNSGANTLTGNAGNDTLDGGAGTDSLRGGTGNDTYLFARGYGADTISENDATAGNTDTVAMGVDALDVVLARSGSNLLMTLHGGTDKLTVGSWYSGSPYQTEVIKTADGQQLLNTQVDQLIQAMAQFSASTGLTWDQALDQRPQDVQAILSAYWQPAA